MGQTTKSIDINTNNTRNSNASLLKLLLKNMPNENKL